MGTYVIIVIIIVIIIWAHSSSSNKPTYTPPPTRSQTPIPPIDYHQINRQRKATQRQTEIERRRQLQRQARCKSDWQEYQSILTKNNINTLYHFTDKSNLKSIKRHGALYSWHYCLINNIKIPVPGGNQLSRDLDTAKEIQNYVRASFTRSHPMMHVPQSRAQNCVILEIEPEVIYWNNSKYANKNAVRNDVHIGSTLNDFRQIKFKIVKLRNHFGLNETDKPYYQGEILILEKIPAEFIRNIR